MDNFFQKYLSEVEWLYYEDKHDPELQPVNETLFTLGNGYIGSRGIYEETPHNSLAGTFFAGIFEESAASVAELVNAPNPFHLSIHLSDNEKLDLSVNPFEFHQRILDLKKGLLARHTVFKSKNDDLFDYQSIRFISNHNLNIAVMQVAVTPLTHAADILVNLEIDASVKNHGRILEHDRRNFVILEKEQHNQFDYLSIETLDKKKQIDFGQALFVTLDGDTHPLHSNQVKQRLDCGQTVIITKIITFFHTKKEEDRKQLKQKVFSQLTEAIEKGTEQLFSQHIATFEERWPKYDIQIVGDAEAQLALRLNIYHLMIVMHKDLYDVSIGARMLSGEGYKGHVFWETELLLFPCYLFSEPTLARRLLEYRFNRLEAAKKLAESRGSRGALFPWESAESGLDETPVWSEDLDGTIKIVHTGKESIHINVALFYAIYLYYYVTFDINFMLQMGLSMIIEMARFWKSRVIHNKKKDIYRIKKVMGPDEFHDHINDNAYTNHLVAWSLEKTLFLLEFFQNTYPDQTNQILKTTKFYLRERQKIAKIAKKMYIPTQDKIILQFDNFLKLKALRTPSLDIFGIPTFPPDFLVVDLYKTQLVKQADVVLLLMLLPTYFDQKIAEANFHFYDARTLHKSSWSAPVYSAVAAQLNFMERAYHYLMITLNTDKKNIYRTADNGMHTPSVGGAWIALIYGFCGVRVIEDRLLITPHLPPLWQSVKFKLNYLNLPIDITITKNEVRLAIESDVEQGERYPAYIQVGNVCLDLKPNTAYVVDVTEDISSFKS